MEEFEANREEETGNAVLILIRCILSKTPSPEPANSGENQWRERRKSSFDLTDLYGDP